MASRAKPTDAQRDALAVLAAEAASPPTVPARTVACEVLGRIQVSRALHGHGWVVLDETTRTVKLTNAGRAAAREYPPKPPIVYDGPSPVRRQQVPKTAGLKARKGSAIPRTASPEPDWRELDDPSARLDYVYKTRRRNPRGRRGHP